MSAVRKVGVEEELLLVHPETGELANAAGAVLHDHRARQDDEPPAWASTGLEGELLRDMLETHTDPTDSLAEIGRQLREARRTAIAAAEDAGVAVAATGTAPLGTATPVVSSNARYERIIQEFGDTGRGAGTLGLHVHVDVADDEEPSHCACAASGHAAAAPPSSVFIWRRFLSNMGLPPFGQKAPSR